MHHLNSAPSTPAAPRRATRPLRRPRRPRRRGITSAMAMIFMVLIATLAIGFYSLITTSQSVAQNDQKGSRALVAAESGIQFMRLRLAHVRIPPQTTSATLLTELRTDLAADLAIKGNLGTQTVSAVVNDTISIPAEADGIIVTDPSDRSGFSVKITKVSPTAAGGIVCTITGHSGTGKYHRTRDVRLHFIRDELESIVLEKAVAAKGTVTIVKGLIGGSGVPDTIASVMSSKTTAPAVSMSGGTLGGGIGVVADGLASVTGGSVHGETNLTAIKDNYVAVIEPPEFPHVDTTLFAGYATNTYTGSSSVLQNVRIPANTNPKFSGSVTIRGILYIEAPNVVEFGGNASVAGFIVFQNAGTSSANSIKFGGNATISPLPTDTIFDPLRSITGIAVLAPTATVTTTGNSDSHLKGNLIVGTFNELGSATIKMERGSILAMDPGGSATFNGNTVRFMSTGVDNPPSVGLRYTAKFVPSNGTYAELN